MALWLVCPLPTGRKINGWRERVNLDLEPCRTIKAMGLGGDANNYWIEEDGVTTAPAATSKPPFRVPSMSEVACLPPNGFVAASTFSGCGGSSLGYKMAGFRVAWASEFIPAAQEVYRLNHPSTPLDTRDIRQVTAADFFRATGIGPGQLDLLDGSPPCASFSTAGKREAGWGQVRKYSDTQQRTDDLFGEFARLLRDIKPKTFVAENVSGLVKGTAKGYFLEILKLLKDCGYEVAARTLDAQWLGVPQSRVRLIFVGVRNDIAAHGFKPAHPSPLPYRYSVRDAIPWIVTLKYDTGGTFGGAVREYDVTTEACGTITTPSKGGGVTHAFTVEAEADITRYAIGREWDNLKPGEQSDKYLNLVRVGPDSPCPTICASHGSTSTAGATHPTEKRKFSIAELKRICAFSDDFQLTGTYAQQWERLGRAVPPVMMFWIARTVRDRILIPLAGGVPYTGDPVCLLPPGLRNDGSR